MFNDVCTVYNKYVENGVEKWQRTVLTGVFWDSVRGTNFRKTGLENADSVNILIPNFVTANRAYMEPKSWQALQDKSSYWTLQPGDTILKGAVTYGIVKSSRELEAYDDSYKITKADYKGFGSDMDHWEVGAK